MCQKLFHDMYSEDGKLYVFKKKKKKKERKPKILVF